MQHWLIFAVGGIVFWGLWGFTSKLTMNAGMDYLTFNFIGSFVLMLTSLAACLLGGRGVFRKQSAVDLNLAVLGGILAGLGQAGFFGALQHGPASLVVPLCALYPGVTIVLSFAFLHENLSKRQKVAIGLSLVAGLVLAMQQ